ncbi:hypothetical protein ACKWTF_000726 [Chironomus riparius]
MSKFLIILIFMVIAIAQGAKKSTLNSSFLHFKKIGAHPERFENSELAEHLKNINFQCFKEHLQLDKYGDKLVNGFEEDVFYKHSAIMCHEDVINEFMSSRSNDAGGKFNFKSNKELIKCFKSKLFEIEPTSKLIVDSDHENIKKCNTSFINLVPNKLRNEYVNYNAVITDLTCGKLTQNEFTINFIKGFLVDLVDLDEDVKKSEAKEIKEAENLFTKYAYDCIIKRFEDEDGSEV